MYPTSSSKHFSKLDHDFSAAYLISTLNPKNKTWEQQLDNIFKILDKCHINIKSPKMASQIRFWFFNKQAQNCAGYWQLSSDNFQFKKQYKIEFDKKFQKKG